MEKFITKHPGSVLEAELHKLGMKQNELAIRTGVSEKHISTIIAGEKGISSSLARKLEYALGSEKGFWARLQADYDSELEALKERNEINSNEISVLKRMKEIVGYFIQSGIMHNNCGEPQKVLQLREILRVSNLLSIPKITYNAAYRAQLSKNTNADPYVLFAWQRLCEMITEERQLAHLFSEDTLRSKLSQIKSVMFVEKVSEIEAQLNQLFSQCGIAFGIAPHFRGAPVQGFIKEVEQQRTVLCMTTRGKKADRFWFTLFHEIGHLLHNDATNRFVDFNSSKTELEENADRFARDTLIDPIAYKNFIANMDYENLNTIKDFSKGLGIPHWITIGRLHNDEWLEWSQFAQEIPDLVEAN